MATSMIFPMKYDDAVSEEVGSEARGPEEGRQEVQ